MTTRSKSEADKVAAAGFTEVYEPVKPYLDELDAFLQSRVTGLDPKFRTTFAMFSATAASDCDRC